MLRNGFRGLHVNVVLQCQMRKVAQHSRNVLLQLSKVMKIDRIMVDLVSFNGKMSVQWEQTLMSLWRKDSEAREGERSLCA